jgi:YihY family inner membrane protein
VGLVFSVLSMSTAMAQVERGTNRIYGIRRDRKAVQKYGRALLLTGVLAVPIALTFLLLVAGGSFGAAMHDEYGWSHATTLAWNVARYPAGLLLLVVTISVLLDHAPRRRQPALSWLALGAGIAVTLSMLSTMLLAAYIRLSGSFGATYGPLAGVFALLLWSLLTSVALFAGAAVSAQLEQLRAGRHAPVEEDPGRPPARTVDG